MKHALSFNNTATFGKKNKSQYKRVFLEVLNAGNYFHGNQNKLLEEQLRNYFDLPYITTTASGHDALFIALASLGLSSTDEIIFPVNAYPTAFPVLLSGAKPIPVDVDQNGQINIKSLIHKLTKRTKVVIVVHLYGLVGNLHEIQEVLKKRNITLIEDCAQAFGTKYNNKLVGTFGDIACFSFYPTKNVATLGNGGAIATKRKKNYDYFIRAKQYGEMKRYNSEFISGHSRLPEIQAGILNIYIKHIEKEFQRRKTHRAFYLKLLDDKKLLSFLRPLLSHSNSDPVSHLFVISCKNRNTLKKYLSEKNIETNIHYPLPIHLIKAFKSLGYKKGDFPMAEELSKRILSLPFHPDLTSSHIKLVSQSLQSFYL